MPSKRNARGRLASASVSATDGDSCKEEQYDKASSARGRGKRKVPIQLSPGSDLSHPVEGAKGDLLEVTDERVSLTEPLPGRILRSGLCTRVVINASGDCPPLKKRRSERVKLKQNTSPKECEKLPGSVSQLLSYSHFPAVETGEDMCILSSNSAASSMSLSAIKSKKRVAVETDPNTDFALASEKACSDIQVKEVDDGKVLMKNYSPSQSEKSQSGIRNELPVVEAKHSNELSSTSITAPVCDLFVSDCFDTTLRIHQVGTRSKPLDTRTSFERMTSRNLMDCLRIESEEDFKPDYDEDDKQDAAGIASARGTHSTKSSSFHNHITTSITRLLPAPFQASPTSLPSPIGAKSALLFQPCPSTPFQASPTSLPSTIGAESTLLFLAPQQKYPTNSDEASDGDAIEGTHKILSRKEPKDSLDLAEIFLPDLTDCPLSDTEEDSEVAIMKDLNCLDDVQFLSRLSQHIPRSPVSISNPVPHRVVKVSGGSKPLNLASKFQSAKNKQAVDLNKCIIRPGSVGQRYSGCVTPDTTANPQVSSFSSASSFHVAGTVTKVTSSLDVDQTNSTLNCCDSSPKDGVNSSAKTSCLSLSSNTSSSDQLTQSIAVQTDEDQKVCFSSEIESYNQVPALCLLNGNTEQQQLESKSTIILPLEGPHVDKIQSSSEGNSVAKVVCEVQKIPISTCSSFPTTKSRISPRIPAAAGSERILKTVIPELILDSTKSLSVDDNSNPRKIRLNRPWKLANKRTDVVSDATNTTSAKVTPHVSFAKVRSPVSSAMAPPSVSSAKVPSLALSAKVTSPVSSAKVPSPVEKSVMLQANRNPDITLSKRKCEAEASSSDTTRMKQLNEVEMDVSRVLLLSPALQVSASVLRQSSKESGASEELLEGDGSSNEEDYFREVNLSLSTNSRNKQSSPAPSNHRSPVACSQHLLNQSEEILTESLLSAEENQLKITVTAGERSIVSLADPDLPLDESSFASDVAMWVSQKETKTDSLLKSIDIKKADWSLSAVSSKAYTSDLALDLFEELTCEEFGSEFEDFSETSPTKDALCEALPLSSTASGSLSSEENLSSFEKRDLPILQSLNSLVKTGWFPIPSRSAVIPARTSVVLPPSESMTKRKVALLCQDPSASQSSRFTTEELPAKRFANALPAAKHCLGTKAWQPETVEDVFQRIRNLMVKQDWKSLSQLILISSERKLYMAYLAEALMSISDISIKFSFKNLVMELETSSASEIPSFKKYIIGLVGIHVMERCTAFGNWSDAFEVLAEMLKKRISFHLSFSHEHSAADIVDTAVRVCVNVKKYNMIEVLVRQFDFFRGQLTDARDQRSLIKQKYCCLNVVLVAIVQELPVTDGHMEDNGSDKLVLCNIGISILTQILEDWKEDISKQPEVAELIELTCMFEFLIQGCIVHNCSDGLILLSRLQQCHPEYLEWKTSTLRTVLLFFIKLGMMRVLLSHEQPLNLIQTATEHQLIPKLPAYVPSNSNVLVVWSSLSDHEMRLIILMYLKSILLRVHGLSISSVPWSIQLVHRGPVVSTKSSHMESMNTLQRLLCRDISPSLRWSKLSPTLLHTDDCTVSLIRKILSDASVDLKANFCAPQVPHSLLLSEAKPVGTGDVDLRQLPWNAQPSNLESRVGSSSYPTTQLKESDETLQPPYHFSAPPQNRSSGVRKSFEDNRNNKSLIASDPKRATHVKMATGANPNKMPAKKIRMLDSSMLSVPKFVRKGHSSSSIGGPSPAARKVLLKTPECAEESPKLLQADASVSGDHRPNPAAGSFAQTPSNALATLRDASRDKEMQWDGSSSRRQWASFFQKQNAGASSSDTGLKPQQQDLRQRLTSKKVSCLVELPSDAGTPVKKLLDLALLPRSSPPYLPFK